MPRCHFAMKAANAFCACLRTLCFKVVRLRIQLCRFLLKNEVLNNGLKAKKGFERSSPYF